MIWVVQLQWLVVCAVLACVRGFSPYDRGDHNTSHVAIDRLLTLGLPENLDVWLPTDPGTYKVIYYLDSFGGITPGGAYDDTMDHMASHGVAVLLPWRITLPLNPKDKVPIFVSVMEWAEEHLEDILHRNGIPPTVHLDLENIVLGGHSAGSHVLVEYLKSTCGKVQGQVLMSPVDGMDPGGIIPEFCITPGQTLNYNTPSLHLAAGLDPIPGPSGYACAPKDLSNDRFFDALDPDSQRWSINATEFGHGDLLDSNYQQIIEITSFCAYNEEATEEELAGYRKFVAGQTVTFIKALFTEEGDCSEYLPYLEDPNKMSVNTELRFVNPIGGCPVAGCLWWPEPVTTPATD